MIQSAKEITPVAYNDAALKAMDCELSPKRLCFRAHWHDRMEFLRIREGELRIDVGGESFVARENELVMIPPKISHKAYAGEEGVHYEVLMFDLRSYYNETEICKKILPALFQGEVLLRYLSSNPYTVAAFDSVYLAKDEGALSLISQLYLFLDSLMKNEVVSFSHTDHGKRNQVIADSIAYLEENFAENLQIPQIGARFGYSSAHFSRKFKEVTGLSPIAYLNIFRLEVAYKRLRQSTDEIGKIAMESGFSDANYFTRAFKKHFGFPPSHYRKEQKQP